MLKRIASFCAIGLALSTSASAQTFANSGPITIVDGAHASPYPSLITVNGLAPGSSLLSLSMYGFSHTFQADLDIVFADLTNFRALVLTTDRGNGAHVINANVTFADGNLNFFGSPAGDITTGCTSITIRSVALVKQPMAGLSASRLDRCLLFRNPARRC